jgi:hypothetical protein
MILGVLGNTLKQLAAQILVRHFAPSESQSHFYLVAVFKELEHVAHLDVIVIGVGVWPELDLFDLDDLLLLARFGFALLRFVLEFAEIHDLADRWIGIWRNFDQIKPCLFCQVHGAGWGNYSDVFAVGADQAYFVGADLVVYARAGVSLWRRVVGSASDGGRPLIVSKM